jgi:hypothetical protein
MRKAKRQDETEIFFIIHVRRIAGFGLLAFSLYLLSIEIPKLPQKNVWTCLKVAFLVATSAWGLYCMTSEN